jgi:hypothetical protein
LQIRDEYNIRGKVGNSRLTLEQIGEKAARHAEIINDMTAEDSIARLVRDLGYKAVLENVAIKLDVSL